MDTQLKKLSGVLISCVVFAATGAQAGLVVNDVNDGGVLASAIAGSGITVSNVSYLGAEGAAGGFSNGVASGLELESGIILSTGQVSSAVGGNDEDGVSTDNGTMGYMPLSELAGHQTYDAVVLSFDFEFEGGAGGDLFFDVIFASEEYLEFVGTGFNDVFAFFLDGGDIALLPDGSPISIDTVNNETNSSMFVDNTTGAHDIEYDGFTTNIALSASGLSAGVHTMTVAIADSGDHLFDSAIFIGLDSFAGLCKHAGAGMAQASQLSFRPYSSRFERAPTNAVGAFFWLFFGFRKIVLSVITLGGIPQ